MVSIVLYNITLPFPPSVNSAYGQAKGQKRFKSAQYTRWLLSCPAVKDRPQISEPCSIELRFYLPDSRLRDCDNYTKVTIDFLVSNQILEDDNYKIVRQVTSIFKGIDKENPRVEVDIKKI